MEIRYTATREDLSALVRHNLRHSPRFWLLLGGLAVTPAVASATLRLTTGREDALQDVLPALIAGLFAAAVFPFVLRLTAKSSERVLAISPAGIQTTVGKLTGAIAWARIAAVAETPDHIFITGRSGNAFVVPARAFLTSADRAAFLQQIAEYRQAANGR